MPLREVVGALALGVQQCHRIRGGHMPLYEAPSSVRRSCANPPAMLQQTLPGPENAGSHLS